jgi:hypothetical protein
MHWLEAIVGISPDGGNGMAELLIALGIAVAVASGLAARRFALKPTRAGRQDHTAGIR